MSTITREFTRELLLEEARQGVEGCHRLLRMSPNSKAHRISLCLAEIALAALTAEPIGEFYEDEPLNWYQISDGDRVPTHRRIPLYRHAPPAPVVMKDHQMRELVNELRDIAVEYHGTQQLRERIARTIRDALLQGKAEPVSQRDVLNSPAAPDGWVLVPVEPTEDMIINGFEAELREEFRDPDAWEAFEEMSGCEQAAQRAKWCWAAMVAAAPQQEMKGV